MIEPPEAMSAREVMALAEQLARRTSLSVDEARRGLRGVLSICGTGREARFLAREFTACFRGEGTP